MLTIILAALPVFTEILKLFIKTPEQEIEARQKALLDAVQGIHLGIQKAQKTRGDTSDLEKSIQE